MTRAKDSLHLVMPQRFYVHGQAARGDRHVYAVAHPLHPGGRCSSISSRRAGRRAEPAARRARQHGPRVDIGARMRGMWR